MLDLALVTMVTPWNYGNTVRIRGVEGGPVNYGNGGVMVIVMAAVMFRVMCLVRVIVGFWVRLWWGYG